MTAVAIRPGTTPDVSFAALGTTVRLIGSGPHGALAVTRAFAQIRNYHRRLSRFEPDSELSRLNADPRAVVPASPLLRSAVRAGLQAARRSDGLVDPCLLGALEAAGYARSFNPTRRLGPPSGPRHPARPHPARHWTTISVDDDAGTIARPPGLRLDLGGSGKGHVADLAARHFASCPGWVVDCGGDIRAGGRHAIEVAHPLDGRTAATLEVCDGAIATSSVVARAWRRADAGRAHHLLDPATGRPAWTGLLSATALAPTALHAETLAKVALLRGGHEARAVLREHGGVLVHDGGDIEVVR